MPQALGAWTAGDWQGAIGCWERILLDHPTDLLALRLAHYGHFYLGDPRRLRDSTARVLPSWSGRDAGRRLRAWPARLRPRGVRRL